jgi:hypothetical protein
MAPVLLISGDIATLDPQAAKLLLRLKGFGFELRSNAEWPGDEVYDAHLPSVSGCIALIDDAWLQSEWRIREIARSRGRILVFGYPITDPTTWTFREACPWLIRLDRDPTVAFNQIYDERVRRSSPNPSGCFTIFVVLLALLVLAVVLVMSWLSNVDVSRMLH